MERTLVLIKPDGVQRRLIGRIIDRFESKGLKVAGMKLMQISQKETNGFLTSCTVTMEDWNY